MFLVLQALPSLNLLKVGLTGELPALVEGGQVSGLDAASLHPHQKCQLEEGHE